MVPVGGHISSARMAYPGKRVMDILFAGIASVFAIVPIVLIAFLVKLSSTGPVIYWSDRVGRNNMNFRMPKFRTMRMDAPAVASHLLNDPDAYLTAPGKFLRKTSLDELPQLWSIMFGNMSVVGPRPALFNQSDLIVLRTEAGVDGLAPGLTGWAQVNGRDELPVPEKVALDVEYMQRQSFWFDLKIIFLTFVRVIHRQGVSH